MFLFFLTLHKIRVFEMSIFSMFISNICIQFSDKNSISNFPEVGGAVVHKAIVKNVTIRTSPLTGNLRKAIVLKTGRSEDDDESKLGIKDVLLNTKSNRTVGYQQKVFEIKKQPPHQLPAQNAKDKLLEISVKNAPVIVSITRSKSRVGYVSVKREEDGKGSKTLLVKAPKIAAMAKKPPLIIKGGRNVVKTIDAGAKVKQVVVKTQNITIIGKPKPPKVVVKPPIITKIVGQPLPKIKSVIVPHNVVVKPPIITKIVGQPLPKKIIGIVSGNDGEDSKLKNIIVKSQKKITIGRPILPEIKTKEIIIGKPRINGPVVTIEIPNPPKIVPVKPLPPKITTRRPIPPKVTPRRPIPPKKAPVRPNPPKMAPVRAKPPKVAPVRPNPPKIVPVRPKPPKVAPVRPNPPKIAPIRPKPPKLAPVRPNPPKRAPVRPNPPVRRNPPKIAATRRATPLIQKRNRLEFWTGEKTNKMILRNKNSNILRGNHAISDWGSSSEYYNKRGKRNRMQDSREEVDSSWGNERWDDSIERYEKGTKSRINNDRSSIESDEWIGRNHNNNSKRKHRFKSARDLFDSLNMDSGEFLRSKKAVRMRQFLRGYRGRTDMDSLDFDSFEHGKYRKARERMRQSRRRSLYDSNESWEDDMNDNYRNRRPRGRMQHFRRRYHDSTDSWESDWNGNHRNRKPWERKGKFHRTYFDSGDSWESERNGNYRNRKPWGRMRKSHRTYFDSGDSWGNDRNDANNRNRKISERMRQMRRIFHDNSGSWENDRKGSYRNRIAGERRKQFRFFDSTDSWDSDKSPRMNRFRRPFHDSGDSWEFYDDNLSDFGDDNSWEFETQRESRLDSASGQYDSDDWSPERFIPRRRKHTFRKDDDDLDF